MRKFSALLVAAAAVCPISGCSSAEPDGHGLVTNSATATTSAPTPSDTAQTSAESIRAAIPEVTELVVLTEDNDPNHLIGRPNGYVAATVILDSRVECPPAELGVGCGATVEQWPDQAAAQRRADYLQTALKSMPMLGTEWTTVNGNLLLRVTGKLKPSAADGYQVAFAA